jgi:predicted deacylase
VDNSIWFWSGMLGGNSDTEVVHQPRRSGCAHPECTKRTETKSAMTVSYNNLHDILGADPGIGRSGYISGPRLVDGTQTAIPIYGIRGRHDGPTVIVSAGSHGDEINAIRTAAALGHEIKGQLLRGQLIVLPVLNPLAFRNRSRLSCISPTDQSNLHDSFPGTPMGDSVSRVCNVIVETVFKATSCDLIVDLHTGALGNYCRPHCFYSSNGREETVSRADKAAVAFNSGAIIRAGNNLRAYATPSMIHAWAHDRAISAVGVELGTAVPSEADQV